MISPFQLLVFIGCFIGFSAKNCDEGCSLKEMEQKTASSLLRKYVYTVGLSGNRTKVVEHQASGIRRTVNYEYDMDRVTNPNAGLPQPRLYRLGKEEILNSAGSAAGTFLYKMDAVGNRLNRTVTGLSPAPPDAIGNQTMLWDQLDRHDYNENIADGNVRYDANGNTVMTGEFYDAENRLIRKNGSPWRVSYVYDHEGNKVQRIYQSDVNNPATISTVHYLVDDRNPTGYAQQMAEMSSSGGNQTVTRTYLWGQQLISQTVHALSATHYIGLDGHGSVRMLFDSAGAVASTYDYDAYGNLLAFTGTTANSHRYGGEWYDDQVKAYYQRARYYNYGYGRFWSRDSFEGRLEDPQSLHKYVYCHNDPVNNIDPSGTSALAARLHQWHSLGQ